MQYVINMGMFPWDMFERNSITNQRKPPVILIFIFIQTLLSLSTSFGMEFQNYFLSAPLHHKRKIPSSFHPSRTYGLGCAQIVKQIKRFIYLDECFVAGSKLKTRSWPLAAQVAPTSAARRPTRAQVTAPLWRRAPVCRTKIWSSSSSTQLVCDNALVE